MCFTLLMLVMNPLPLPPQTNLCQSEIRPDKRLNIISQRLIMIVPTRKDIDILQVSCNRIFVRKTRDPTLEESPQKIKGITFLWAFKMEKLNLNLKIVNNLVGDVSMNLNFSGLVLGQDRTG